MTISLSRDTMILFKAVCLVLFARSTQESSVVQLDIHILEDERISIESPKLLHDFGTQCLRMSPSRDWYDCDYTGKLYAFHPLDREIDPPHYRPDWTAHVYLRSNNTYVNVRVILEDVNDNKPIFTENQFEVFLPEHSPPQTQVLVVNATDLDAGANGMVTYSLISDPSNGNNGHVFTIDATTGAITTTLHVPDLNIQNMYSYIVKAADHGTPPAESIEIVKIIIVDPSSLIIEFDKTTYKVSIPENTAVGDVIRNVRAMRHYGEYIDERTPLEYSILMPETPFSIEPNLRLRNAEIKLNKILDYDTDESNEYTIEVVAHEGEISGTATLVVMVTDVNDNGPVIEFLIPESGRSVSIPEDVLPGTEISVITVSDIETTDYVQLRLFSHGLPFELHTINQTQYILVVQQPMDRESIPQYRVRLDAIDRAPGFPPIRSTADLMVQVTDVNDNYPMILNPATLKVLNTDPFNYVVGDLDVYDRDSGPNGAPFRILSPCNGSCPCSQFTRGCGLFSVELINASVPWGFYRVIIKTLTETREQGTYAVPVVIADSGTPSLTSTSTVYVKAEIARVARQRHYKSDEPYLISLVLVTALAIALVIVVTYKNVKHGPTYIDGVYVLRET